MITPMNRNGGMASRIVEALMMPQGTSMPSVVKLAATTGRVKFCDVSESAMSS